MTPEEKQDLLDRIERLEAQMSELSNLESLPIEIQNVFEARLGGIKLTDGSSKAPTDEREMIDDGLGVHYAAAVMDGFVKTTDPLTKSVIYLPYYS